MRTVTVKSGQSIWDIALQEHGSVAAVDWITEDNNIGLCDYIPPATKLAVREEVIDKQIVDYYKNRNIELSSEAEKLHGIGQWAIEINFEIQ